MPAGQIIKVRRGTTAAWTSGNPTLAAGEPGYETDTGKIKIGDGSTAWNSLAYRFAGAVTFGTPAITLGTSAAAGSIDEPIRRDATIAAFDATAPTTQAFGDSAATGSAAVAARRDHKHAMPATPTTVSGNAGTATALQTGRTIDGQTFDGTANITVIAPGTHAATTKATPADADEFPLIDSAASNVLKKFTGTNLKAYLKSYFDGIYGSVTPPIGSTALVYRYTVTGSDKASIDTGVDTPDAGSNDWTNGDLLEVFLYARTDDNSSTSSDIGITFNNTGGTSYHRSRLQGAGTGTPTSAGQINAANLTATLVGAGNAANVFGALRLTCPNYMSTVGYKQGELTAVLIDTTVANMITGVEGFTFASTSAISRLSVAVNASGKKLKVGSQLLIYKRLAS